MQIELVKSDEEDFAICKIIDNEESVSKMETSVMEKNSLLEGNAKFVDMERTVEEDYESGSSGAELHLNCSSTNIYNAYVLFNRFSKGREGKCSISKFCPTTSSPCTTLSGDTVDGEGDSCFLPDNPTFVENCSSDDAKLDGSAGISDFSPIWSNSGVSRDSGMPQIEPIDSISNIIPNDTDNYAGVQAPLLGYEVLEQRSRCTVYTINVRLNKTQSWFVFRRYSEFYRLNLQLKNLFPHICFDLPPKKWFGDNFDRDFLQTRMSGLQSFINDVISRHDVRMSEPVRLFLCLDDPDEPFETLEGCRALCESLEGEMYRLRCTLKERDTQISMLNEHLALQGMEISNLKKLLTTSRTSRSTKKEVQSWHHTRSVCT